MSINQNEIFQFYGTGGYNPPLSYLGYDENWVLGRRTAPQYSHGEADEKPEKFIELKMSLCSEARIEKVKTKFIDMDGVTSVECDDNRNKVTVRGKVDANAVLAMAKKIQRNSEFWENEG